MKFAPIPPTGLLGEFSTGYHLCLAHLLSSDERQMVYYKGLSSNLDDYVILDNGAYEYGCSIPFRTILEVAKEIGPDEIVLPDVLLNKRETILSANEGHKLFIDDIEWASDISVMAVPQGESTHEWMQCFDALVNAIHPDVIGIPVVYESKMGRGVLIKQIISYIGGDLWYQPDIHLLGWDGDLYKLSCYARDFPLWIRGIDSAKPFYYTTRLDTGIKQVRPKDYFDQLGFDRPRIQKNLDLVYSAAEGVL
jgi:hypothetical protein